MSSIAVLHTDGRGYWSRTAKAVPITKLHVECNNDYTFGELRVYFDPKDWDVETEGLIYTDKLFERELFAYLVDDRGLVWRGCGYSEQGMQGDDYVSFDVSESFLASWLEQNQAVEY